MSWEREEEGEGGGRSDGGGGRGENNKQSMDTTEKITRALISCSEMATCPAFSCKYCLLG